MRYLVNKYTKEHIVWPDTVPKTGADWRIVEADSDGWIAWDCEADLECPISEDQPYHVRLRSGSIVDGVVRWDCYHNHGDVLAYRPILAEKAQEPEPQTIGDLIRRDHPYKDRKQAEKAQEPEPIPLKLTTNTLDLLGTLSRAHEHAQTIPDLEAELRQRLDRMGYDLVARNPFVEPEDQDHDAAVKDVLIYGTSVMKNGKHVPLKDFYVEPEPAVETPQDNKYAAEW